MSSSRREIYINDKVSNELFPAIDASAIDVFHRRLPGYGRTPLVSLPGVAEELNVKGVYVKDESHRFGLPSFKILGASWGAFWAIATKLGLPLDLKMDELGREARRASLVLFAATDGNHGRAVAFTARLLGLRARIYVPATLSDHAQQAIANEGGATLVAHPGDYDAVVQRAHADAAAAVGGVLVQDTSFAGYEDVPVRIVDGYATMLREADAQLADGGLRRGASSSSNNVVVVTPVGVGSLAHAVVRHFRTRDGGPATVVAVEPDTAACLHHSLTAGACAPIATTRTIMTGMDCGTVSATAWPDLQAHVAVCCSVSDHEAHVAVEELIRVHGVDAGPCGAASLAALRRIARDGGAAAKVLHKDAVVVLLCTERSRPYEVPCPPSSQ
jgi:diaminopropionate ammonia-lyase family